MLWGKEKYLLTVCMKNYKKIQGFFKTNVNSEESVSFKNKQINWSSNIKHYNFE